MVCSVYASLLIIPLQDSTDGTAHQSYAPQTPRPNPSLLAEISSVQLRAVARSVHSVMFTVRCSWSVLPLLVHCLQVPRGNPPETAPQGP